MSDPMKSAWQRRERNCFKAAFGYSQTSHYATGQMREAVLQRDGYRCVECGMTDQEHKAEWDRPITIDHKDRDRKNNDMSNLQTLCLRCHGRKDLLPRLRAPQVERHKDVILELRSNGMPYQEIADRLGFSIASIWKWARKWGDNTDLRKGMQHA